MVTLDTRGLTPGHIINKPIPGDYIPKYGLRLYNDGKSFHFLSLILKSVAGLDKNDADNKAIEISIYDSAIIKVAPLETVEVLSNLLEEKTALPTQIEKV